MKTKNAFFKKCSQDKRQLLCHALVYAYVCVKKNITPTTHLLGIFMTL